MPKKILIAEDEKPLATVLNLKLKSSGFETKVVYNGEDALAALQDTHYDLLLIDIMMPKRDGFSVLESLAKAKDAPPIFVMSNLGQQEDIARVKTLGAKDYIIKADTSPIEITQKVMEFFKL